MSRIVLYPYPRPAPADIQWSPWSVRVDDRVVSPREVVDKWDADANLFFQISVSLPVAALTKVEVPLSRGSLVVSATCSDSALTVSETVNLAMEGDRVSGVASTMLNGRDVSGMIELTAYLVGSRANDPDSMWLERCILAEAPVVRLPLDSSLSGFPTVAFSFSDSFVPDAPWRFVIEADSLISPFAHSVRLELNEDYPLVVALMDGHGSPFTESELFASVVRVLIGTASRLADQTYSAETPDSLALSFPDSIAASALRASKQYLNVSLGEAIRQYRNEPQRFELALATGSQLLRGKKL